MKDVEIEKEQGTEASGEGAQKEQSVAKEEEIKDPRLKEIKENIDKEKKQRFEIIDKLKMLRKKVGFKKAEQSAISKLLEGSNEQEKKIGYLFRLKEKLEFKISTGAFTLDAEKDLIRKINEVNEELDSALKKKRLRKRIELLGGDIEALNKEIEEKEKLVKESEKKLDALYDELRGILGRRRPRQAREKRNSPKEQKISLADIAIIKEKKVKGENGENKKVPDNNPDNNSEDEEIVN
ncbi:MAG: hypothetical protein ACP5RT_00355 [Candidatus Micrarchaeia archaeon]